MKRRNFIKLNMAVLGGVVLGENISHADMLKEAQVNPGNSEWAGSYDLVVNGAGIAGCFAALEAAGKGLRVLIVDKRTSPGFDIAGKRKLWIRKEGIGNWPEELLDLFCPEGEKREIFNRQLSGVRESCSGDEMLLFAGSLKKGLVRSLLVNGIDLLLMTDVCGVITDKEKHLTGITIACKQGVYAVGCHHFLDATDNNFFSRDLFGQKYKIEKASFVLELENVKDSGRRSMRVSPSYGIMDDKVELHAGKKYAGQGFLTYQFAVQKNDLSGIEQQARRLAGNISKDFPRIGQGLEEAVYRYQGLECSFYLKNRSLPSVSIKNYICLENPAVDHSGTTILDLINKSRAVVQGLLSGTSSLLWNRIYYIGGSTSLHANERGEQVSEEGKRIALTPFSFDQIPLTTEKCDLLIVGGGTAGTIAAQSAAESNCKPVLVEYFNDLGGSKTQGGVLGYYLGLNKHPYIVELENRIKESAKAYRMNNAVSRSFYHFNTLSRLNCDMRNGTILCGAQTEGNKLTKILLCINGRLHLMEPELTIDATGDADIAGFVQAEFHMGNGRMGMTQNYSQWDVPFRTGSFPSLAINKDYDLIDNTKITELQRGLYLSHYESLYYDFYPMLTVREARLPKGMYTIQLNDIIDQTPFEDVIANANSDFDPHHFSGSEYTRCSFLLPHTHQLTSHIPYRAIVPEQIDGLLFSGRGTSHTHHAIQFTRMSADIILLGYATGQIAAEILRLKVKPRDFSVRSLQERWRSENFLVTTPVKEQQSPEQFVKSLSHGRKEDLFTCCRQEKQTIIPYLSDYYQKVPSLLLAKALAWFGEIAGVRLIIDELEEWFRQEQQVGHPERYYEEYHPTNLYWRINQDIGLLGMAGGEDSKPLIHKILLATSSGGSRIPAPDAYNENRIDLNLIPFYNRLMNLAFYIERNPDAVFIEGLERLLDDPEIGGFMTVEFSKTRWTVYSAMLELNLAAALARCGSLKGLKVIAGYLKDAHSDFRRFACKELKEITGKDHSFDLLSWMKYLNNLSGGELKVVPLRKTIDN